MTESSNKFNETAAGQDAPYILVARSTTGSRNIDIHGLTVRTPGQKGVDLVRDVSLTLRPGDRVILTGKSGTGKTTVAKAMLNQWDYGDGWIVMPPDIKIMSMSQQPHFPNTTLRSIMNMAPEGKHKYRDEELTGALKTVGHNRLIQHIPGQQIKILIDSLRDEIDIKIAAHGGGRLESDRIEIIVAALIPAIDKLAAAQFETVQFMPDAQRRMLTTFVGASLARSGVETAPGTGEALADAITRRIDIALAKPLCDYLCDAIPEIALRKSPYLIPYSNDKIDFLAWSAGRSLAARIKKYRANEDTDDAHRDIRINQTQAEHVVAAVTRKMRAELQKHANNRFLSRTFNLAVWPLSAPHLLAKAATTAHELTSRLTFFMDRQILTGDHFKTRLSGGEKQKLMIAMALLHKPDVLILDEVTAALDQETGEALYAEMMEKLPADTIVLSIAHNRHIMKYHTHHAELADQTIHMRRLDDGDKPAPAPPVP